MPGLKSGGASMAATAADQQERRHNVFAVLALCALTFSMMVAAEKGDTITTLMTAKDLPPGSPYVAPTGKVRVKLFLGSLGVHWFFLHFNVFTV